MRGTICSPCNSKARNPLCFSQGNYIASKVMNSALQTLGLYIMNIRKGIALYVLPHTYLRASLEVFSSKHMNKSSSSCISRVDEHYSFLSHLNLPLWYHDIFFTCTHNVPLFYLRLHHMYIDSTSQWKLDTLYMKIIVCGPIVDKPK